MIGRYSEILDLYSYYKSGMGGGEVEKTLGFKLLEIDEYDKAKEILLQCAGDDEVTFALAKCYLKLNEIEKVHELCMQKLNYNFVITEALAHVRSKNTGKASELLLAIIAENRENPYWFFAHGVVAMFSSNFEEAISSLRWTRCVGQETG